MPKFRKKPVVIEANQWDGSLDEATSIIAWVLQKGGVARYHDDDAGPNGEHIMIDTLEGSMRTVPGDWVICGVQGEFYPCKPEIFEATYEEVLESKPFDVRDHPEAFPSFQESE